MQIKGCHDGNIRLSVCLISLIFSAQVFNNKFLHIVGPLTLGEVFSVTLLVILLLSLSACRTEPVSSSGKLAVATFAIYWVCALGAVAVSPVPGVSINFLATVTVQLILFLSILLFLKPDDVVFVLKWLGLFAALCGLINFWNSVPGAVDIFQARQNPSRGIAGIEFPFQRVVSFTNIYAQLGGLLVFGFYVLLGCALREHKAAFDARMLSYLVLMAVACLGLLALQSRTTLVGFFAGMIVFLFFMFNHRFRLVCVGLIAVLAIIFLEPVFEVLRGAYRMFVSVQSSTVSTRLAGYQDALELIQDHPFGIGQGAFRVFTEHSTVLHNSFLDAFLSTGWIGGVVLSIAVFIPFIVLLPIALSRNALAAGFLAAYVSVFSILNFYTGLTEYFFWLLIPLGIVLGRCLNRQAMRSGTPQRAI